eukprot:scpid104621/ scgid31297/ 
MYSKSGCEVEHGQKRGTTPRPKTEHDLSSCHIIIQRGTINQPCTSYQSVVLRLNNNLNKPTMDYAVIDRTLRLRPVRAMLRLSRLEASEANAILEFIAKCYSC